MNVQSAQIMRFSYSEKYGTEKTSYSYIAHAMWNNKNEPRKLAETSKNHNVMKKSVKNGLTVTRKPKRSCCMKTD